MSHPRRPRAGFAAVSALAALLLAAGPAAAAEVPPWLKLQDGATQPQFSFANAIEEVVFVESDVDTDRDGKLDRIRIRISRPSEAAQAGHRVPVVFEHSPYRGNTGPAVNHDVDLDTLPQDRAGAPTGARAAQGRGAGSKRGTERASAGPAADLPGSLDNYYVPRGYAVVLGESIGTFNSQGCPDVGADAETLGAKAVIDWLNGRARGFDAAGAPARATWSTGDVGMIGTSYNGTLPNQVATTGVEGLRTIVPVSAISSWYDYYRANGLVVAPHSNTDGAGENDYLGEDTDVLGDYIGGPRMQSGGACRFMHDLLVTAQDRITGDYSPFWAARDYLGRADRVEASVFVVHGLNDYNVKTKAFAEWWYRLAAAGVERRIWLHNGGHGGPQGPDAAAAYRRAQNRWFDHHLFGVANGVASEPRATVQREDGSYAQEADWPAPGVSDVALELSARSPHEPGTLTAQRRGAAVQRFVDRGRDLDTDDVLIQDPDAVHPNRLVFRTAPLLHSTRMSGTPWVDLRMSIDNRRAANLTAVLVDYGAAGSGQAPRMVTRGWLDPQNREGADRAAPIVEGHRYGLRWDLQPDDHVFPAGHRIGLVVVSTDHDYTIRPLPGTRLSLAPAASRLTLPVVGGAVPLAE